MNPSFARVLAADDHRDTADTTADLLRMEGYEVVAVYDGLQAVAAARSFRPHVAVLDINMPGLNGYQVAAALRELETEDHRFVLIAHTARMEAADLERAHQVGFDHFIAKPAQTGSLRDVVRASLAGSSRDAGL